MVVREVYSADENKMLEQWQKQTLAKIGWLGDEPILGELTYPVFHRVVTKDLILNMANGIYDPNPLFRDEDYGKKTRWGTIIAPPFFEHCIAHLGPIVRYNVPPEVGVARTLEWHTHWEFSKPIRIGDSFRVWCSFDIEDETESDGNSPRKFLIKDIMRFINQKNEVVCNKTNLRLMAILTQEEKDKASSDPNVNPKTEEYRYTGEELAFLDNVSDAEQIYGSNIRWWEDVNVGDELQPIVKGPITPWDLLLEAAGLGINTMDTRQIRKLTPQATGLDRDTGVWHYTLELHLVPRTAKWLADPLDHVVVMHHHVKPLDGTKDLIHHREPLNHIGVTMEEHTLARVITNWMGDDGFLKSTDFRIVAHPPIGDAVLGRGKVIKKYITSDREHVVEIACWLEGIRGYIHNIGTAMVGLLSRENMLKDLQRY